MMKKLLVVLLSLLVISTYAEERKSGGAKPINHAPSCSGLVVSPVDNATVTPSDLVESILGPDIQSYTLTNFLGKSGGMSDPYASAGLFIGGIAAGIGIPDGIILSSGYVQNAVGPNSNSGITGELGLPGDADLNSLQAFGTNDATVLEFDFVPNFTQLYIQFVFGSDEYNFYANSAFNDVFAFYLNGTNIALVPNTTLPISINEINLVDNPQYYINNESFPGPYCTEMDGFTTVLVASGNVTEGQTNHIKLAIADGTDDILDSWVLIAGESFGGTNPEVPISDWALFIGIGLIVLFAIIRFRRLA